MSFETSAGSITANPCILLGDRKVGIDMGIETWYSDANYEYRINDKQLTGTIRHKECPRAAAIDHLVNHMCNKCLKIPTLQSFRKRLLRRKEDRDSSKIRNDYLTQEERDNKLKILQAASRKKDSKIFLLTQEKARLKNRRQNLLSRLREYSKRGSMAVVCHQLNRAAEEGMLENETVLKEVLVTCANNISKKKQGKRYSKSVKEFYEVLMYWGGPRIASFVAMNMLGPEVHSMYRWRKQKNLELVDGIAEENFVKIAMIYKDALRSLNINVALVQLSEDETAIIKKVTYNQRDDTLVGFCGKSGDAHQCMTNCVIKVGDGEEGYNTIVDAFKTHTIGCYGRLIMINTLHPSLPNIPVLMMSTCNTFDHEMVHKQFKMIGEFYKKHIEPILGPLTGPSSDGDSRRRKMFLKLMRDTNGCRFQPIPKSLGFVLTCEKIILQDDRYVIRNNCDQDSIHNHKKLVNHLDHQSRSMRMGTFLVHLNHVREVYERFDFSEHGLRSTDIDRDDKQNWRSAQRLSFKCIQTLMERTGNLLNCGTKTYLEIVWMYVEVFHSTVASLYTRIMYAATISNFLAIWQNWVRLTPRLTLKENFVSTQTYIDVVLSCHSAVNLVCFMRDNFPDSECHLAEAGTDCCETTFSSLGQWVGNHHNYTLEDMLRNRSHQIRLEQLRADPNGPKFAKPHPKGESIWHQQKTSVDDNADLKKYPLVGEEIKAWKEGILKARKMAAKVGICPKDSITEDLPPFTDDDICSKSLWFYQPFHFKGNTLEPSSVIPEDVIDEEDDVDFSVITKTIAFGEEIEMLPSAEPFKNCVALNADENNDENDQPETGEVVQKISPTVTIPGTGKSIYKSKLVNMLNEDPKLSKDRLTRVRQRQEFSRKSNDDESTGSEGEETVALFSEYVIVDRVQQSFSVGQVERIRCGGKDYRRPEPLNSPKKKDLSVVMAVYKRVTEESGNVDDVIFKTTDRTLRTVPFTDLLCEVLLTITDDDTLVLNVVDAKYIDSLLKVKFDRRKSQKQSAVDEIVPSSSETGGIESIGVDGTIQMVVEPVDAGDDVRRSKRKRTVRIGNIE